jgi:hypothetical protein
VPILRNIQISTSEDKLHGTEGVVCMEDIVSSDEDRNRKNCIEIYLTRFVASVCSGHGLIRKEQWRFIACTFLFCIPKVQSGSDT